MAFFSNCTFGGGHFERKPPFYRSKIADFHPSRLVHLLLLRKAQNIGFNFTSVVRFVVDIRAFNISVAAILEYVRHLENVKFTRTTRTKNVPNCPKYHCARFHAFRKKCTVLPLLPFKVRCYYVCVKMAKKY